jgi:dihydrofolate reductase
VSLDGFFEGPRKELDWFVIDPDFLEYSIDLLRTVDTLLFGSAAYEYMANYWPSAPAGEIAGEMNNLRKIVFSKTLERVDWNNSRLVTNNIPEEVSKLKSQPGKDMAVLGSASLASSLMRLGLAGELATLIFVRFRADSSRT